MVTDWLYRKRLKSGNSSRDGAHREFSLSYRQDKGSLPCYAPRIAFRDGTNRLNERTMIACLIPPKTFLANTAPYILLPRGDASDEAFLLGVLPSRCLDWYARRFLERHANFFLVNTFPIPRPSPSDPLRAKTVALAGRLAAADDRFSDWAKKVGVKHGPLMAAERQAMIDELDAVVAKLYGLSELQLAHLFETFHEGWDYELRLRAVLKYFHA